MHVSFYIQFFVVLSFSASQRVENRMYNFFAIFLWFTNLKTAKSAIFLASFDKFSVNQKANERALMLMTKNHDHCKIEKRYTYKRVIHFSKWYSTGN